MDHSKELLEALEGLLSVYYLAMVRMRKEGLEEGFWAELETCGLGENFLKIEGIEELITRIKQERQ